MPQKQKLIWYHPDLKEQARELHNNCTKAEYQLWQLLKGRKVKGYDFHRQKPLLYYIVDFYCPKLKLAIELDGKIHDEEEVKQRDYHRQEQLEECGIHFLRFNNEDVHTRIDYVINVIENWIDEHVI